MQRVLVSLAFLLVSTTMTIEVVNGAQTDWQVLQTLNFESEPMDMVVDSKSRRIYVLTKTGKIRIYGLDGKLRGKIDVGKDVFQIKSGSNNDMLYLLGKKSKTMRTISISLTENIDIKAAPFKGAAQAPVTIAVFSDFQCPYCSRLVSVLDQVLEQYPQQVKMVFKHFPLRNHPFAVKAAQATIAAHRQGKFWEFHDLLFEQYKQINDQKIEEIRTQLELNNDQFQKDMKAPETMAQIRADAGHGRDAGVRGTPTVFINGKILKNKSMGGFRKAIDDILKASKSK